MKIRCIKNRGKDLRLYENRPITDNTELGRFGATGLSEYNELEIGKEYLVMGIIIFETYQAYLIDDNGFIAAFPCQLFEVINDIINANWHFRLIGNDEDIYPFVQAIFGYPELCSNKKAYENLIVEKENDYQRIYLRRKIELEQKIMVFNEHQNRLWRTMISTIEDFRKGKIQYTDAVSKLAGALDAGEFKSETLVRQWYDYWTPLEKRVMARLSKILVKIY